jgi:exoribonuclease-2
VVTIDDAATTEIDDGLSLETLPGGSLKVGPPARAARMLCRLLSPASCAGATTPPCWGCTSLAEAAPLATPWAQVWVHIADPSRWVAPGSPLAREAARRSKSLYLPTGTVPMFPRALAEGPFSLRAGLPTEAVSVGAALGPDGALLPDSVEVVPSRVAPARRLTYMEVDEMLEACREEDEPQLFALAEAAAARHAHRLARGAVEILMPECAVRVRGADSEQPAVEIEEEDQFASPARQVGSGWVPGGRAARAASCHIRVAAGGGGGRGRPTRGTARRRSRRQPLAGPATHCALAPHRTAPPA